MIVPIAALICWIVKRMLKTDLGMLLRAVGDNPQMITSLGKSVKRYKLFGLASANALTALAGAIFVQWTGFFSITGNIGTLVIGLACLFLGEMIKPSFGFHLIIGAVLYQALFAITIGLQLDPVWNNLIKALLIIALFQLRKGKNQKSIVR